MREPLLPGAKAPLHVPHGWQLVRLRQVARNIAGGRLGLTKSEDYRSAGYPAFSAAGCDGYVDRWEFDGDAVVVPSIGSIGRAYRASGRWTTLANTQVVFPNADLDSAFLHHRVDDTDYWPVSGTAQPFIKPRSIGDCWLALPPLGEQRKIAEILDTVDEAIRKTEAIIAKLKQVKQGLLHDLLTRGIDENGELRDPDRHPEQFKDSPLGHIPAHWSVEKFSELAQDTTLGTSRRGTDGGNDNIALLKMGNLEWGGLDLTEVEQVARARVPDWRKLLLREGDLLFNTRNTPELVGKTAAWRDELDEAVADNNILRVRFGAEVSGIFLAHFMGNGFGRRSIGQLSTGTTSVAAVYWKSLRMLEVPVPPRSEQDAIVSILDAQESRTGGEQLALNKLRLIRQGLMEDLLTGRVRVTELLARDSAA